MKKPAYGKINLGLDIVGKRQDGYHLIDTLFLQVPLADYIEITETEEKGIILTCSDKTLSIKEDNLVYKAAEMLLRDYGVEAGIRIHLEKNIPMGAGLGGGSSDAATTMKIINELFSLNIEERELMERAATLGSDVPFFIKGGCARATGVGERLTFLNLTFPFPILIIKPSIFISTPFAYKKTDEEESLLHPCMDDIIKAIEDKSYKDICAALGNSFDGVMGRLFPLIAETEERVKKMGAGACILTGSGSAMFAVFKDVKTANNVKIQLQRDKTLKVF